MDETFLKQAEELPEEIKGKAVEIYNIQQKIYAISDILLREVVPADEADLLYFLHSSIKMMPQPYRDKLFHETGCLLEARRKELEEKLNLLKKYGKKFL